MSPVAEPIYLADHPAVVRFLQAWHENGRAPFERMTPALDYDDYDAKIATDRRRFVALERKTSGVFLLERSTGMVWSIKAYGRPKARIKHIDLLTADYEHATASHREVRS